MKDVNAKIQYKEREYTLVFNLNVMERIQEEYGSVDKWGDLTEGKDEEGKGKEPNAKAVIFGFTEMINEGIDIENEEKGTDIKPMTLKQVGRMITEIGLEKATGTIHNTVIKSTESTEKNE